MPKYKRWTQSAMDCYFRGCVCDGCPIYKILRNRCRMKSSVIELVRLYGIPEMEKDTNEEYEFETTC